MHVFKVVKIQLATIQDSFEIAELARNFIEADLAVSWTTGKIVETIKANDTNVIVAKSVGEVLGFAIMQYRDDVANLLALAVRPKYRRHKIGSHLVAWLERCARVAGNNRIYSEVRSSLVEAQDFYKAIGYQNIGVLEGHFGGKESAIQMSHTLQVIE